MLVPDDVLKINISARADVNARDDRPNISIPKPFIFDNLHAI